MNIGLWGDYKPAVFSATGILEKLSQAYKENISLYETKKDIIEQMLGCTPDEYLERYELLDELNDRKFKIEYENNGFSSENKDVDKILKNIKEIKKSMKNNEVKKLGREIFK